MSVRVADWRMLGSYGWKRATSSPTIRLNGVALIVDAQAKDHGRGPAADVQIAPVLRKSAVTLETLHASAVDEHVLVEHHLALGGAGLRIIGELAQVVAHQTAVVLRHR